MKKFALMFVALIALASAQITSAQVRTIDMEEVTKTGGNCEYDDENCVASFSGRWDRWIDLPGVKGDISATPTIKMEILKSNVILRIAILYKGDDVKPTQVEVATFYSQMGKEINSAKTIKIDLIKGSKGKVTEDMLKNIVSIRVAMAKECSGAEEPFMTQFGKVTLE